MAQKRKLSAEEALNAIMDSTEEEMDESDYHHSDDFESENDTDDEESDSVQRNANVPVSLPAVGPVWESRTCCGSSVQRVKQQ